jgi:hypothetical protein
MVSEERPFTVDGYEHRLTVRLTLASWSCVSDFNSFLRLSFLVRKIGEIVVLGQTE